MKRLILLCSTILLVGNIFAQESLPTYKIIKESYGSETMLYLDSETNEYITKREFIKKYSRDESRIIEDQIKIAEDELANNNYIVDGNMLLQYIDNSGAKQLLKIPVDNNGDILYSSVVEMDNYSAKQIYSKAKLALTDFWKSVTDVTHLDDAENNIIISKGKTKWLKDTDAFLTRGCDVWFSMKIECRDGRCRISVYGLSSSNSSGNLTVDVSQSDALKHGVKRHGVIKSYLQGFSWLAWRDVSVNSIKTLTDLINKADANTSDDW